MVELFDANMQTLLPEQTLRAQWEAIHDTYGTLTQVLSHTAEEVDGYLRIALTVRFVYSALDMYVIYDADGLVAGMNPQPAYNVDDGVPLPDGVVEQDVVIRSGAYELPGKLSLPAEGEALAAVVIVQGSGPSDKDGSVFNLKPYRDIAWGLAQQGVAALRFDKRDDGVPERNGAGGQFDGV